MRILAEFSTAHSASVWVEYPSLEAVRFINALYRLSGLEFCDSRRLSDDTEVWAFVAHKEKK